MAEPLPGADKNQTSDTPATTWRDSSVVQLTLVRMREFIREPEAIFWVFVFPILMSVALGIAFRNSGPERVLIGLSGSAATTLAAQLATNPGISSRIMSPVEATEALRLGKVALVVVADDANGTYQYRYDSTRPESHLARLTVDDALQRIAGRTDPRHISEQLVSAPGSRYIDFLIPGLIGMNLMGTGIWGGYSIVTARLRKLLKLLAATPMRRTKYLVSFMISRLFFATIEVVAVVAFGWLAFGVRVQGRGLDLALVALIGALSFSGLGIFIASRPRTIEGLSGLQNATMLPMWLLSGTFFSAERFPQTIQPLIHLLPLTALNGALRAIMLEGRPLVAVWSELLILAVWGAVCFMLALRLFRWQ